jgi:hypothetical protein
MTMSWRIRRVILISLLLTLCESFVSYYIFTNISYRITEKKALIENQTNQIHSAFAPPSSPPASEQIIYGPNGSKQVFVEAFATIQIGTTVSGQLERTYTATLGFLEVFGNFVDLIRNADVITAVTACVLCLFLIGRGRTEIPKSSMPSL